MSRSINIGASNNDPTYRYKMPSLNVRIEGSKTVILNMREVAKSLHCEPTYPTQFFSLEFGTQTQHDKKKNKTSINGRRDAQELARTLDKFISLFILCPTCKLPETHLTVQKRTISADCAACGFNGLLNTHHKLESFILKNPPAEQKSLKGRPTTEHETPAHSPSTAPANEMPPLMPAEEDIAWATDTSAEAILARQQEALAFFSHESEMTRLLRKWAPSIQSAQHLVDAMDAHREDLLLSCQDPEKQLELLCALSERKEFQLRTVFLLESLYNWNCVEEPVFHRWWAAYPRQPAGASVFMNWLANADVES